MVEKYNSEDYRWGLKCKTVCKVGKGCKYRKQKGMSWGKLKKLCPKGI